MILPRFIRKWLAILRGGVAPQLIFLSVIMGFWFGLMPDWSGLHVLLLALALILNVHIGLFLIFAGLAKALCFAAAPALYHIGVAIHSYVPVIPRTLSSIPIIGLSDFSKYAMVGAVIAGPALGAVAGLLLARSVIAFRKKLLKLEEGSERFKKWYSHTWVRILDRLLIGKRTKDAKALFTKKTKYIRKAGIVLVVLLVAVAVLAASYVKDGKIRNYAADKLTRANGAEVNVESFDLSLLASSVSAAGIQVTDRENPSQNQLAIEKLSADASLSDLLVGKLVMQDLHVANVAFDQPRAKPGEVVEKPAGKSEPFDPCDFEVTAEDIEKIEKYIKDAKALKEKLQKLRKWLPKPDEEAKKPVEKKPEKFLDYLRAAILNPPAPRVVAQHALIEGLQTSWKMFGNSNLTLTNVNDAPRAARLPVGVELTSNETDAMIRAVVDFNSPDGTPRVSGTFEGFDLGKMQSALSQNAGLAFQQGLMSGAFTGTLNSRQIDMTVQANLSSLQAAASYDGILGMDAKTTTEVFSAINELKTTVRIVGPVAEPRIIFDVKGLTEQFKEALVEAGKQRLMKEVDDQLGEQIDKAIGDNIPDELKNKLKKPQELLDGLGGLFKKD